MLGDEGQDHLPADGCGPGDARRAEKHGKAVVGREPVAAVALDGLVQGADAGLRGRVLGHIGGLASRLVVAFVIQGGCLGEHETAELNLDVALREGVGQALVGADGDAPDVAFLKVAPRLVDREAAGARGGSGPHDALRVEAGEEGFQRRVVAANQRLGGKPHVIDEELALPLALDDVHLDRVVAESGGLARQQEHGRPQPPGSGVLNAGDNEHGIRVGDPGHERLAAGEDPVGAVLVRDRRNVVRIAPGVWLGDAEGDDGAAVSDARQPSRPLLRRSVPGEHGSHNGRGDHHHDERRTLGADLLEHDGELVDSGAAAAVLRGQVHPEEPGGPQGLPQLGHRLAAASVLDGVLDPELPCHPPDGFAQRLPFRGLGEAHDDTSWGWSSARTASTAPTSTAAPAVTGTAATRPARSARTTCCIFMASITSSSWPALTWSPTATRTATTVPGSGARRDPESAAWPGSGNRPASVNVTAPASPSTSRRLTPPGPG